jgi:hypothetical protein
MTNDELDDAVAVEALRICEERPTGLKFRELAQTAARLAREGWTPPEPVDPDVLAFRAWACALYPYVENDIRAGGFDDEILAQAYLAGARMAREQEQERAKVLVEPAEAIVNRAVHGTGANDFRWPHILKAARRLSDGLNAYKAGMAAR